MCRLIWKSNLIRYIENELIPVARGVQARQMGAKHRSEDDDYYDDELDGKSTDGIVDK